MKGFDKRVFEKFIRLAFLVVRHEGFIQDLRGVLGALQALSRVLEGLCRTV